MKIGTRILAWAVLFACLALTAAAWWFTLPRPTVTCDLSTYQEPSRDALILKNELSPSYLDQGWGPRESMDFYTRPQGSRLLPYDWFVALERADSETPFRDPTHMAGLGFLTQKPNPCNPEGLPVGFVKDPPRNRRGEEYFGFTCAACHTAEIHYGGRAIRIDGGPSMADMQGFLDRLTEALKATLDDPAKFARFAERVGTPKEELRRRLRSQYEKRLRYEEMNAAPHRYGFARLDAFGRIMNSVLVDAVDVDDPSQVRPPDAPVSYPHLWDTPYHDRVQWNGFGRNDLAGSERLSGLARNVGQVLGVFGEVQVSPPGLATATAGYQTSVRTADLIRLEALVRELKSPRWPESFPELDPEKLLKGEALYRKHCVACHAPIDRDDPERRIEAVMTPLTELGTDPRMAKNFSERQGKTGRLEGRKMLFMAGDRFGETAPADRIVSHVVVGAVLNKPVRDYKEADLLKLLSRQRGETDEPAYKARPLNGIWATAPFLHNGSVPNLYELLLPAEERSVRFHVGNRAFDPERVGFVTEASEDSSLFETEQPGNSNAGHEYGTSMTDEERWQLLEYLKSL